MAKIKKDETGPQVVEDIQPINGLDQTFTNMSGVAVKLRDFLKPEDTWELKKRGSKMTIATHDAVQKIADEAGIFKTVGYKVMIEPHVNNNYTIVVEATVSDGKRSTNECGEANRSNLGTRGRANPFNMAQKRAYDRAVFRHLGIEGLLSEDELPDEEEKSKDMEQFEKLTDDQRKAVVPPMNEILNSKTVVDLNRVRAKIKKVAKNFNEDQLIVLRNQWTKKWKALSAPKKTF